MAEYKYIIVIKIIDSYVTYYYILTYQVKYYLKWI